MLPLRVHLPQIGEADEDESEELGSSGANSDMPFASKFNISWVRSSVVPFGEHVNHSEILSMIDSNKMDVSFNMDCKAQPWLLNYYKNISFAPLTTVEQCHTFSCHQVPREQNDDFLSFLASFDLSAALCSVFLLSFFLSAFSSFSSKEVLGMVWKVYGFFFNGLEIGHSKLAWKKVMLMTFGVFVVILQIIALSFVQTSFVIPEKCEKIETVADMAEYNITLLSLADNYCAEYIRSSESDEAKRVKPKIKILTSEEVGDLYDTNTIMTSHDVFTDVLYDVNNLAVDQGVHGRNGTRFVGRVSSYPFYEYLVTYPLGKNTPKKVVKKLKRYLYSEFEQGISNELSFTHLKTHLYMLSKPPLDQAIAVPLSVSYFKTVIVAFFFIVTLALLAFLGELIIHRYVGLPRSKPDIFEERFPSYSIRSVNEKVGTRNRLYKHSLLGTKSKLIKMANLKSSEKVFCKIKTFSQLGWSIRNMQRSLREEGADLSKAHVCETKKGQMSVAKDEQVLRDFSRGQILTERQNTNSVQLAPVADLPTETALASKAYLPRQLIFLQLKRNGLKRLNKPMKSLK